MLRLALSIAALVGCSATLVFCSYYPPETNGTGGTTTTSTATGGNGGHAQGGNAQGGGGASQGGGGSAQGGNGTGGSTSSGGSGGSPPVDFLSCDDVAPGHGVMKGEVTGDFPPGLERIVADGADNKGNAAWKVEYVGAVGAKQAVKDFGTMVPGVFVADLNWGLGANDTAKQVGDAPSVAEVGTYLCYWSDCMSPLQALDATFIWCHGTTELCRTDNTKASGWQGTCTFTGTYEANMHLTVP